MGSVLTLLAIIGGATAILKLRFGGQCRKADYQAPAIPVSPALAFAEHTLIVMIRPFGKQRLSAKMHRYGIP